MILRLLGFSLFSFVLGIVLVAAISPAISSVEKVVATTIQDDRAADRQAIRAHIDSIFQAFIRKDAAALRATHAQNWLGYLEGSREMIKGIDGLFIGSIPITAPMRIKNYGQHADYALSSRSPFSCITALCAVFDGSPLDLIQIR